MIRFWSIISETIDEGDYLLISVVSPWNFINDVCGSADQLFEAARTVPCEDDNFSLFRHWRLRKSIAALN